MFVDAPSDIYYASGACGQVAMVFPSARIVVSMMTHADLTLDDLMSCGEGDIGELVTSGIMAALIPG